MANTSKFLLKALKVKQKSNKEVDVVGDKRLPPDVAPSIFGKETKSMAHARHLQEQAGHRGLGISVHSETPNLDESQASQEQGLEIESSLRANPLLDSQRFDGFDPASNPEPAMNTEARKKYDEVKEQQKLELQMRLGLSPGNAKVFNPRPEAK